MPFDLNSFSQSMRNMESVTNAITEAQFQKANPVIRVCAAIKEYIEEFEKNLDTDHEIAMRLASFGGELTFHAEKIGFSAPNVITFYGVTDKSERVQLIQHVSQLSFLLKAVEKLATKANRIGFIWDEPSDAQANAPADESPSSDATQS